MTKQDQITGDGGGMKSDMMAPKHPFERAGLGRAPFRFVGLSYKVGPIVVSAEGGVTTTVGAPGQPMGSCDFCGQGIAECCTIVSADGKRFTVGNVCVNRTQDSDLARQIEPALKKHRRKMRHAREAKRIDWLKANLNKARSVLSAQPHPSAGLAKRGKTLWDYAIFMLLNSGNAGKIKLEKLVRQQIAAGGPLK